jgi:secretion/DNA translocation related CpaE-like protein
MNAQRPLLISSDSELIDDVLRLAAANAVEIHLATDVEGARSRWPLAPLVLVGADAGLAVAGARMTRRRDVVLVTREPTSDTWQNAVTLGAEHVVTLPDAERWLIDRLADCEEGPARDGRVIAVMGAGAGSGASTFAATLALAAADRALRALLIDADPLGGGLTCCSAWRRPPASAGPTWPRPAGGSACSHWPRRFQADTACRCCPGEERWATLSVEAMSAVIDAAARGFDIVIVDLPRHLDAATEVALSRAEMTLLVASNRVRTTAAAARIVAELDGRCSAVSLVLRVEPKGLMDHAVEDALTVPGRRPPADACVPVVAGRRR